MTDFEEIFNELDLVEINRLKIEKFKRLNKLYRGKIIGEFCELSAILASRNIFVAGKFIKNDNEIFQIEKSKICFDPSISTQHILIYLNLKETDYTGDVYIECTGVINRLPDEINYIDYDN